MGTETKIQWTDATWNPWVGCTKVSPACANCYMFDGMHRYGRDPTVVTRTKPATFRLPLKKHRNGEYVIPPGSKVFTCSWSDWFHVDADPWRSDAWDIIRQRPDVTFQIVTKRTDRIAECLPPDWGDGWPNVWLIATAENQEWIDKRMMDLLSVPAVVRGLSIEPLLGPVEIGLLGTMPKDICAGYTLVYELLSWVIVGVESSGQRVGRLGAFFDEIGWMAAAEHIVRECADADVAVFVKQIPMSGKICGDVDQFPPRLRVRQFPETTRARH